MTQHNKNIGRWGENEAANYLIKQGYKIIGRNIRTPYGEIDIVARMGDTAIFVKVKTRTSHLFGYPEESIMSRKHHHLLQSAEHYASENDIDDWQIDAISVEGVPGNKPRITHFENFVS